MVRDSRADGLGVDWSRVIEWNNPAGVLSNAQPGDRLFFVPDGGDYPIWFFVDRVDHHDAATFAQSANGDTVWWVTGNDRGRFKTGLGKRGTVVAFAARPEDRDEPRCSWKPDDFPILHDSSGDEVSETCRYPPCEAPTPHTFFAFCSVRCKQKHFGTLDV